MMKRRTFVKAATAASILAGLPRYSLGSPKGSDVIKVGIIGCGARGTGALRDMINADSNIKIVAMADAFADMIASSLEKMRNFQDAKKIKVLDVPEERQFVGLDSYKKLLEIQDIDVVILAAPPVFRPLHLEACLKAGKHVFAEKPICIDAAGARKIKNELIPLADSKKLCVVCGNLMRFAKPYEEAVKRIQDGQIGEIVGAQVIRYAGKFLEGWYTDKVRGMNPELLDYQLRNWLAFIWTSGDQHVEQHIHNLDLVLWMMGDKEPLEVLGSGGRCLSYEYPKRGNRFSDMNCIYSFGNGVSLNSMCRQEDKTSQYMGEKIIGTKGTLETSFSGPFKITGEKPWLLEVKKGSAAESPYVTEHRVLMEHVRNGEHINTMAPLLNSCMVGIAGREAAYSGKRFKYAWVEQKSQQNFLPDHDALKLGTLKNVAPVPVPGEYQLV